MTSDDAKSVLILMVCYTLYPTKTTQSVLTHRGALDASWDTKSVLKPKGTTL